jgi:hypothetical protein
MSLDKLQKRIESDYPRPIRLEKTKRKRKETLHEFLIKFLTDWNDEKDTIYADDKSRQTKAGKRRSLGDIFMICKYYYPDITLEEVLYELYVGLNEYFTSGYRSSYCFAMLKRTFYYDEDAKNAVYNKTHNDEYGNPYRYYLAFFKDPEPDDEEEDDEDDDDGDDGDWDDED